MMDHNINYYFNKITELLEHFLVLKTESQNRKLEDCQMKRLIFLMPNKDDSPKLVWMKNSRLRLEFKGICLKQEDEAAVNSKNVVKLYIFYELNI